MEFVYKWNIEQYDWEYFNIWIINDIFSIDNDIFLNINRLYSKKKNKYYANIFYETKHNKYHFILFKNWYIMIWITKLNIKQVWDLEFPYWMYLRLWL